MNIHKNRVRAQLEQRRIATVTEVMDYARLGRNTVYRAIQQGDILAYKNGRILRVDLDSVDAWLRPVKAAK